MYTIEHLSHTTDIRLLLKADKLEDLFRAGLASVMDGLLPGACEKPCPCLLRHEISIEAVDTTVLLIDFLSEALTHAQADKAVFCQLTFEELTPHRIRSVIEGRPVTHFEEDIKAVTYHEAEVEQDERGQWATRVIFDI